MGQVKPVSLARLWPGETVVCMASGPSLTQADADVCRGRARVIVVNDAWRLAPWADALYGAGHWFRHYKGVPEFAGLTFGIEGNAGYPKGAIVLRNTGREGLERDPSGLKTGANSGHQAIGLAVHLGARRILLLGYDCQRGATGHHFFGNHPQALNQTSDALYLEWRRNFGTLVAPLAQLGIAVVNCSRRSALPYWPRLSIDQALCVPVACAL